MTHARGRGDRAQPGRRFGGGLRGAAPRPRGGGHRRPALGGGAEEPEGAEAGRARSRRGRRADLRLGRRRNRPALPRHGRRGRGDPSRSFRRAPRTCSPRTSASRRTSPRAVSIGLRGERRRLDVGRFNGERFGVMAGAGFDAAMIHDADGGLKDRLGRAAYVWTGSQNLRAKPFKAKIEVDGVSVVHAARRAASSSATSATCSAASRPSRTRAPTTAGSRSASSLRTASADWARDARAHRGRARDEVAVRTRDDGAADQGQARPEGAATSSTAATARR